MPINSPSSGRHTGGPPRKDSPYGVSPATSKCFIRVPSPYTQLLNWRVFKQPRYCQQARELIKIFAASAFPRKEGEMRRRRRGGEGRASRPGNRRGRTSRRDAIDRATAALHAFIPLSLSNYLRISPSLLDCTPSPPAPPLLRVRSQRFQRQGEPTTGRGWPAEDLEVGITPIVQATAATIPTAGI